MSGLTPTQRTLKWLRDDGWNAEVVERWIPWANPIETPEGTRRAGNRKDLFGMIDIVAIKVGYAILGVQCFGAHGMPEHLKKVEENPQLSNWLDAGGDLWLVSWRKVKVKRGKKATTWEPRVVDMREHRDRLCANYKELTCDPF